MTCLHQMVKTVRDSWHAQGVSECLRGQEMGERGWGRDVRRKVSENMGFLRGPWLSSEPYSLASRMQKDPCGSR